MDKLSVIVPSRNCIFLKPTVDDIFEKAASDIEVIVVLDGCWPEVPLSPNKNLVVVHKGEVYGMRANINTAARISKGKYIMKCDDHCMFAEGFDEILKADCEPDWLAVPSRYSLDPEKWERTKGPIDYLTLSFPFNTETVKGTGLHDMKWRGESGVLGGYFHREKERKHILIDDIITFQGSCWFMHKKRFFDIECLKEKPLRQEAEELSFKVWLSGGRVIRNKKTWYAHLYKGRRYPDNFKLSRRQIVESEMYYNDLWMNNKWPGQTRTMEWLIDKFWPLGGWPGDWKDPKYQRDYVHPRDDLLTEWKAGNGILPRD